MRQGSILDPVHPGLAPAIWNDPEADEPVLKPHVASFITTRLHHILEIHGYAHPEQWLSLTVTGSLTTYQYGDDSDCDVSLFVDSEAFPEWSRAEMIGLMISRADGTKIPGTPYPLQDFVVARHIKPADLYRPGLRSGYSITEDRWIVPPERSRIHNVEQEENAAYMEGLQAADKMERMLRYEPDKAVMYWHQIHAKRMHDQSKGKGDYSPSNIIYKFLSVRGLFPKLEEATGEHIAAESDTVRSSMISWPDTSTFDQPMQPPERPRQWSLGHSGKGFILQDGSVHTWPTEHMQPTHAQEETRRNMASGYKIAPVKRGTEFHIEPTGRVWQYGSGRSLDADDQNVIQSTPALWTGDPMPASQVQSDPFGHAIRLMGSVEEHQAVLDAHAGQNLQGLPGPVNMVGQGPVQFHSHGEMQQLANQYNTANGLGPHPTNYVKVNPNNARAVAAEYDRMDHNPNDPQVAAAYDALVKEARAQYDHAVANGYRFEFYPQDGTDPYPNSPREAVLDLHHNKHMHVYPTAAGFGTADAPDHPLMGDTGIRWNGQPVYHNDLFRAIHDFYGHAKEGLGFRADGEDNAYRQHQAMFSPLARQALASETRGQNSWVNYGPYGESNQTAKTGDTVFAPQKAGIMPDWTTDPDLNNQPEQQPVTSSRDYEGIVRDGGRGPHSHDRDEPIEDNPWNDLTS